MYQAVDRYRRSDLIGGGITAAVGPIVDGTALLAVDGDATYTFPESSCHQPGVFAITGNGKLFGFSVATAHATFATNGDIGVGRQHRTSATTRSGVFADAEGDIAAHSPFAFYAEGDAQGVPVRRSAFGPQVVVVRSGIGACLDPLGYVSTSGAAV